jgi:hypothetical protein
MIKWGEVNSDRAVGADQVKQATMNDKTITWRVHVHIAHSQLWNCDAQKCTSRVCATFTAPNALSLPTLPYVCMLDNVIKHVHLVNQQVVYKTQSMKRSPHYGMVLSGCQ